MLNNPYPVKLFLFIFQLFEVVDLSSHFIPNNSGLIG